MHSLKLCKRSWHMWAFLQICYKQNSCLSQNMKLNRKLRHFLFSLWTFTREPVKKGEHYVPKYNLDNWCLKESRSLPCVCTCVNVQVYRCACVYMENLWSISYMEGYGREIAMWSKSDSHLQRLYHLLGKINYQMSKHIKLPGTL